MLNYNSKPTSGQAMENQKILSGMLNSLESEKRDASSIWNFFPSQDRSLSQRVSMLGIPEKELTPAVTLAVSALMEKLDDVGHELAAARRNLEEMQQLVDVDCIAPVPNRRAFMRRLNWAIAMHSRYQHPSAVLYFDLNNFKHINDTYGHGIGDEVIRHVCEVFRKNSRESDFLARIGGDEFAMILYYANDKAALKRGEQIATAMAANPLIHGDIHIPLTAAIGVRSIQNGDTAETVLHGADMNMFQNKKKLHKAAKANS